MRPTEGTGAGSTVPVSVLMAEEPWMDKSKTAVRVAGKAYTLVSEDGPEYLT